MYPLCILHVYSIWHPTTYLSRMEHFFFFLEFELLNPAVQQLWLTITCSSNSQNSNFMNWKNMVLINTKFLYFLTGFAGTNILLFSIWMFGSVYLIELWINSLHCLAPAYFGGRFLQLWVGRVFVRVVQRTIAALLGALPAQTTKAGLTVYWAAKTTITYINAGTEDGAITNAWSSFLSIQYEIKAMRVITLELMRINSFMVKYHITGVKFTCLTKQIIPLSRTDCTYVAHGNSILASIPPSIDVPQTEESFCSMDFVSFLQAVSLWHHVHYVFKRYLLKALLYIWNVWDKLLSITNTVLWLFFRVRRTNWQYSPHSMTNRSSFLPI